MAFKEGTWVEHVHAFRDIRKLVNELEGKVDGTQLTPHEALAELQNAVKDFPPAPKEKKDGAVQPK